MEEEPIVAEESEWEWVVECEVEEVTEEVEEVTEDNKETNVNTEDNVNTEEEVDNWKVENE